MEKYSELKNFYKNNPKRRSVPTEMESLYQWTQDQRERFSANKLSKERITLLNKLKMWSWNIFDSRWFDNFYKVKEFEEKNGHLYMDIKSTEYGWLRKEYYKYRDNIIEFDVEKKKLFESLETLWMIKEELTQSWFLIMKF